MIKPILALSALVLLSGCVVTEDGYAIDSIARVYMEGVACKTWAVQLTNDHPTDDDSMLYGVQKDNDELVAQLQHYSETGERVKIHYVTKFARNPCDFSDDDVIYSVEPVNK